ncbi:hypothetical protein ALC60_02574 [Trachymyrmex zeteki]|uniref:Double jelly roll-like domain-containing protein n=1 Tax=Mycetomoellerius zeteki TaxID=64791 RepID=A0A151XDH8_9HYME|nr:hypothetical protein ALC60_02574 [Trachymyrmex zeteki]
MIFETYHTIPNVNESNNKFYFGKDDAEIIISEGSYELRDINEFLKRAILRKRSRRDALDTVDVVRGDAMHSDNNNDGDDENEEYPNTLRANYNTMSLWDLRCASFVMTNILNVKDDLIFDDHIVKIETHTYNPFANTTFEYNDEIRIPIQQQDLYTLPYGSFLYVEGKLTKNRVVEGANVVLENNCIAFLFDEIYELNGVEIDRNRNVGITSTLKNYLTVSFDRSVILRNVGWDAQTTAAGYFNFCVPLYVLLGFCEDYKRVVINARHELILIRARNDNNCLMGGDSATEPTIELFKVQRRMPHVLLSEINKLSMLRALESGQYLSMAFRSWDLYEFPLLQSTTKHSWAIKTATQLEKPRYVIFALALPAYHHGLRWEDEMIPYSEAERLITMAIFEDDAVIYVKGREKRTWLWNLLLNDERERMYLETLDAVYKDMESLTNLDVTNNTMRCGKHAKNCALQNVLKIYNWWLQKNF